MNSVLKLLAQLTGVIGMAAALSSCAGAGAGAGVATSELTRSGPALIAAHAMPMPTGNTAMPPAGLMGFCVRNMSECAAKGAGTVIVALDDQRRHELDTVQSGVNKAITPRSIQGDAWFYPTQGYGECNQYALEKRKELIALGWPRQALLLTSAVTESGEGHLVLVARTSAGDLVLDNRAGPVLDWSYLPYRWVAQQTASSFVQWVSLDRAHG